jgi:hypothetical protein
MMPHRMPKVPDMGVVKRKTRPPEENEDIEGEQV